MSEENKSKILEATTVVFNRKGMKFTMDDIAQELSMSKKTIYKIFKDKEALLYEMVDYAFDRIKESENAVMKDASLGTLDKLKKLLGVLPETYMEVDFRQISPLKEKYPKVYKRMEQRLDSGWEATLSLMEQGMAQGVIRPFSMVIFKATFEAALVQFLGSKLLYQSQMTYQEALEELVEMMVEGIATK